MFSGIYLMGQTLIFQKTDIYQKTQTLATTEMQTVQNAEQPGGHGTNAEQRPAIHGTERRTTTWRSLYRMQNNILQVMVEQAEQNPTEYGTDAGNKEAGYLRASLRR